MSIHESIFPEIPNNWGNKNLGEKWQKLFSIKQEANIAIEKKRANKEIGSSLEAEIEIYTNKETSKLLEGLDLAEYFITSKAKKFEIKSKDENLKVVVKKITGNKCPRCWKILEKKCDRCEAALKNNSL